MTREATATRRFAPITSRVVGCDVTKILINFYIVFSEQTASQATVGLIGVKNLTKSRGG